MRLSMPARFRHVAVAAAFVVPTLLTAQGVTVQSTSDTRFFGALGGVMSMAARMGGASMSNVPSTTYLSGHRMRTDDERSSSIVDVDAGRFTTIDHKAKSYSTMTFEEMAAMLEKAQQDAKAQMAKSKAKQAQDPNASKDEVDVQYKVAVDRPGQHEKIAGFDAEHVFITITLEGTAKPEGEQAQAVGTMVVLLDQWMSKDAPQIEAMKEFQQAFAAKAGQAFQQQAAGLQAAFASDPRLKDGMAAAAKELQKVPGIALRSTTYMTLVPPDKTFDRSLVLSASAAEAAKPAEKKSGGLRGMMNAVKAAAAEQEAKSNRGPQEASQSTLMSVTSQVQSIKTGAVPAGVFEVPPAGYKEVKRK